MPPQQTVQSPKSSVGPIAGAVIVILLLAAGGLYFYGAKLNREMQNDVPFIPSDESVPSGADSDTSGGLPPQSNSDETSSIEADFNAINMTQFESSNQADLNNLDSQ